MSDKIALCDLHGVSLPPKEKLDLSYSDEEQLLEDKIRHDDVFFDEDSSVKSIIDSEIGNLKSFSRNRHQTSKSSGYESEIQTPNSKTERNSKISFFPASSLSLISLPKERRNVFSQTDFSSDDEETRMPCRVSSAGASFTPKQTISQSNIGSFCWRHDSVYDKLIFPPARPSSTSSINGINRPSQKKNDLPLRVSLNNKSCSQCKLQETVKIDLGSRKQSVFLKKEALQPSVAELKNCSVNLLAEEIENCSSLWMENRTFYIGTPRKISSKHETKQRSLSEPNYFLDSHPASNEKKNSAPSTKPIYWIQKSSFACEKILSSIKSENKRRNKRDWILVQPVTKFVLKRNSSESHFKTSYKTFGDQEMILCPNELRSVDYIEEICCQHFIKMTRKIALNEKRSLELLFSPKGPIIREDKHLEGRSIFYFCCDFPIKLKKSKKNPEFGDNDVTREDGLLEFGFSKRSKTNIQNHDIEQQYAVHKNMVTASQRAHVAHHRHRVAIHASAHFKSRHQSAFLHQSTKKQSKDDLEADQNASKESSEVIISDDVMKKTVRFSDNSKTTRGSATPSEKKIKQKDLSRCPSLPPPPPRFLEESQEKIFTQRKRRESVAITFQNNDEKQNQEKSDIKKKQLSTSVREYDKPKWKSVNITVTFENKKYNEDFLEYQTLEDIYSWTKKKLLTDDLFISGSSLMLSSHKINFPLKANTASNTIISLPFNSFVCSQTKQSKSGLEDTNSRYDTRFAIPVDLRKLENLNPIQYLSKYCCVSETWKMFYWKIFAQNDGDKDGLLTYKELRKAMEKLFVELAHPLLKRVLLLTGFDPSAHKQSSSCADRPDADSEKWKDDLTIDRKSFVNLCALANRIICRETKIDGFSVESVNQSNTQLEDADFYNIEGKLMDCNLNPLTKHLLLYVKR